MRGLAILLALLGSQASAACSPDRLEIRGPWGRAGFSVELADTAPERSKGLMFRESLPASAGMLFVYEKPQRVSFWMKNTLIPLDMIFADATGRVVNVYANAVPLDKKSIKGGDQILSVLEIKGGLAARLGITPGSEMRHASLDQPGAVWPCSDP